MAESRSGLFVQQNRAVAVGSPKPPCTRCKRPMDLRRQVGVPSMKG